MVDTWNGLTWYLLLKHTSLCCLKIIESECYVARSVLTYAIKVVPRMVSVKFGKCLSILAQKLS